jgi:hypothetical protein
LAVLLPVNTWQRTGPPHPRRRRIARRFGDQQPSLGGGNALRHAIVCTVGRSGSTLLMGLLNSQQGVLLTGENSNVIASFFDAYHKIETSKNFGSVGSNSTYPWYGADRLDVERFIENTSKTVHELLWPQADASISLLGFKEIRWMGNDIGSRNLWSYLRFIERLLPDCHFIFLTREIDQVMQSGWWVRHPKQDLRWQIETFYLLMRNAPVARKFEIDYAELGDLERLRELFRFLRIPFNEESAKTVLSEPHSYQAEELDRILRENIRQRTLIEQQAAEIDRLGNELAERRDAFTWRATAPLRRLVSMFRHGD